MKNKIGTGCHSIKELSMYFKVKEKTLNDIPKMFEFLNGGTDDVVINFDTSFPHMRIGVSVNNIGCGAIGINFVRRLEFELGILVENHIHDCEGNYYDGGIAVEIN